MRFNEKKRKNTTKTGGLSAASAERAHTMKVSVRHHFEVAESAANLQGKKQNVHSELPPKHNGASRSLYRYTLREGVLSAD